jgi:hypothetical protein
VIWKFPASSCSFSMLMALSELGVFITLGVGHRRKGQCDMIERFSRFMSVQSSRPRSTVFRFWTLSGGSFFFLFLVPFLLGIVARFVAQPIQVSVPRSIELAVSIPVACFGLWFPAWAVFVFWNIRWRHAGAGSSSAKTRRERPLSILPQPHSARSKLFFRTLFPSSRRPQGIQI